MSNQLVKKNPSDGYQNVFPKTWIDAIKDKESGVSLQEILQGFNMYFLSYNGSRALTRCKIPTVLRKEGLWITYVLYDHTVVTEWYNSDQIDDNSWSMDSNWRIASNNLVGDISVSSDGYWVINGEKTEAKAQGEQGVTPLLRVGANNKLQVSYNAGKAWKDISDYIVPRFRYTRGTTNDTAGIIQISMDLGKTWTNLSNEITNNLRISRYIGINESLPTSGVAEGTIYMKGPYYDESDTSNANPIYRMWVYAWKDSTLAWQDNGEFTSISARVVQERGNSTTEVMSQDAITRELTELDVKTIEKIYGVVGEVDIYTSDFTDSIYISDKGVETSNIYRRTTPFIPVVANSQILILNSVVGNTEVSIATYDSQKNFIAKHDLKIQKLFNITTEGYVKFTQSTDDNWSARIVNRDSIPNRTDSLEEKTSALDSTLQEQKKDIQALNANNSNSIFNNLYGYKDVMIGKYLASSGLSDAAMYYKSIKLHLSEGYYYYFTPGSSSGNTLVKFTDDTYASVDKTIVGKLAERVGNIIYLAEGYYIFSYSDNLTDIVMSSANFMALTSPSLLIGKMIGERLLGQNLISSDMVAFGERILSDSGVIQKNVSQYYKLARFEIEESCDCIVKAIAAGDNAILWKYDNEWNPIQEIIPHLAVINRPIRLEKGKYAISWSTLNLTDYYDEHECYVIAYKPELWNNIQTRVSRNYGVDIKDFSEFSGNWTISENKKTAISSAIGIANALTYPIATFEDECEISIGITPTSDRYEIMVGKTYDLAGTLFSIGKDSQGDYVGVYIHSSASDITMTHKFYFTGLNVGNGKRVVLDIRKVVDTTRHYDVYITDANGKVFEKKGISNWQTIEGDQYNDNKDISGALWGRITIYVNSGSTEVDNISFGYPKDMSNLKLVVMGHSFVEGSTLKDEQEKRFSSLLKNAIGEKNVVVIGRGGGGIRDMNTCVDTVLTWCESARYVFMFIGANDADTEENANNLGLLDKKIRDTGIIPIWANIPHLYGQGQVKPILNAYIESNLNYIDVASVFENADGTLNQAAYLGDNLHPSVIGHQLIYNCIRANCSYLFNL